MNGSNDLATVWYGFEPSPRAFNPVAHLPSKNMAVRDGYYPTVITFLVVDGIAVGLRFWARGTKKAIGYDDVTMAVSLIGFTTFCVMELKAIDYGIGATTVESSFDPIKAAMFFTIAQIVYILATGISKLGVALVLFRLADKSDMRVYEASALSYIFAAKAQDFDSSFARTRSSVATIVRLKYVIEVAQMSSKGGLASTDIIQTTLEATV
ncbi:hypothetical protein G7Z17_g915 [Cylindrodendrum hubeiense]|uniref:Rhodopsin domain-containing protein n=1 Tax=Cylindrodendrum hubeiense TaxID=595255 RepID=A0A9P5HR78_9HYPO|nr:hypothetical protein G7Z17_g915 [Cylindrodendrum hubeiense]